MLPIEKDVLEMSTEITKTALSTAQSGSWLNHPDAVAKFFEVIALKIQSMKTGK